jgi:hypothetical protein
MTCPNEDNFDDSIILIKSSVAFILALVMAVAFYYFGEAGEAILFGAVCYSHFWRI